MIQDKNVILEKFLILVDVVLLEIATLERFYNKYSGQQVQYTCLYGVVPCSPPREPPGCSV